MTARTNKIKRFVEEDVDIAVHLSGKGEAPEDQIAEALEIDLHTLHLWIKNPDYWKELGRKKEQYDDWDDEDDE